MTVAAPAVLTSGAISAATSTVTSSITVTAGKPVALAIISEGGGASTISSVTGAGQTWTQAHFAEVPGEDGYTRLWLYTAPATSGGSGAVTITFSDSQNNGVYHLVEVDDDLVAPIFGTAVTDAGTAGATTETLTLSALDGHSRYLAFCYYGEYPTTGLTGATPRSGWTEIADTVDTGTSTTGIEVQYSPLGGDTAAEATFSHSGSLYIVALPIYGGPKEVFSHGDGAINGADITVTLTGLAEGDVVYAQQVANDYYTAAGAPPGLADAGWTELVNEAITDTRPSVVGLWRKVMGATPDASVTFNGTGQANETQSVIVTAWRGVDTTTPEDVAVGYSEAANTLFPPHAAITPSAAGSKVLVFGGSSHARGARFYTGGADLVDFVGPTGPNDAQDTSIGYGYHRWTGGAYTPASWTFSSTDSTEYTAYSIRVALRPETVGGPTDTVAKCTAAAKVGSTVGKANFRVNPSPAYTEGQLVRLQTCMVFSSETDVDFSGLKIIDFENNTISGNPGFRVQVYNNGGNWGITLNLDKLNGPVTTTYGIETSGVTFPGLSLDTPYLIDVEVLLGGDPAMVAGDTTTGRAKIWLDDGTTRTLVYNKTHRTMITQAYWTAEGLPGSITVNLSSIQVGATANSDETYDAVVYLGSSATSVDDGDWDVFSDWESTPPETGWDGTTISSGSSLAAVDAPTTMLEPIEPAPNVSLTAAATGAPGTVAAAVGQSLSMAAAVTGVAGVLAATVGQSLPTAAAVTAPPGVVAASVSTGLALSASVTAPPGTVSASLGQAMSASAAVTAPAGSVAASVTAGFAVSVAVTAPAGSIAATVGQALSVSAAAVAPPGTLSASIGQELVTTATVAAPAGVITGTIGQDLAAVVAVTGVPGEIGASVSYTAAALDLTVSVTAPQAVIAASVGQAMAATAAVTGLVGSVSGTVSFLSQTRANVPGRRVAVLPPENRVATVRPSGRADRERPQSRKVDT